MQYPAIFYVFLFAHLVSIIVGFGAVLVVDTFGALWLIKKMPLSRVMKTAGVVQRLIWLGWCGTFLSGIPMLFIKGGISDLTIIKLFLVVMVGFNGIFLHFIKKALEQIQDDEPVPGIWQFRMFLASTISQVGWWGAVLIGFLNRQIGKALSFTGNPYLYIFLLVAGIVTVAVLGELIFRMRRNKSFLNSSTKITEEATAPITNHS